ncbi:hypothetical protein, partial [Parvimonas sp. M13]|uniref:hypothetical protein n=1 Tax=Parvimonas sp. M13 TaxID=3110694 RepID=UPI002B4755C6
MHPKFTPQDWHTHPVTKRKYRVVLKDGRLHRIIARVFEKQPPSAGGGYWYNKVIWDYNNSKGER